MLSKPIMQDNSGGKVFWFIFFCLLPFVNFPFLLDHDMLPKTICLLVMTLFLLLISWKNKHENVSNRMVICLFILILTFNIYTLFSSGNALNKSEGISDWINLNFIFIFLFALCYSGIVQLKYILLFVPYTVFLLFIITLYQITISVLDNHFYYIEFKISATLSNKNFLSETLVLLLPFTISGSLFNKNKVKRLNIVATILILILVFILQTTSAWLSLIVTSLIFLPVYLLLFKRDKSIFKQHGKRTLLGILLLVFLSYFSITLLNNHHAFDKLKNKISTTREILNSDLSTIIKSDNEKNANSVFERIFLWRNTLKLGREEKWTGIGLSNWKIMWPKYGIGGATFLSSGVMHYEHPHNEFLLFFSELGLTGLLIIVLIFITILYYAFRLIKYVKDDNDRKIILLMSAGIFGFLVLSFFGYPFHRPYSAALVIVMIAVIIEAGRKNKLIKEQPILIRISIIICFIFTLFSLNVAIARVRGEFYLSKALNEQIKGRFPRMISYINKAENKYFEFDLTGTPLNWYRGFAHHYSGSDSALYYFKKAEIQNPYHVQIISDIGATLENSGKHQEAIIYLKRALNIIPNYYEGHFNLAIAYYNLNKPYEALTEINKVYTIGESYDNVLKSILRQNAEIYFDSVSSKQPSDKIRGCIDDIQFLVRLNNIALQNKVAFTAVLKDSCENY